MATKLPRLRSRSLWCLALCAFLQLQLGFLGPSPEDSKPEVKRQPHKRHVDSEGLREDAVTRDRSLQVQRLGSASTPLTLCLLSALLGFVAWFGGKTASAGVLVLLSSALALLAAWSLLKPAVMDPPRDKVDLKDEDWTKIGVSELEEAVKETKRRKRDVVKSWIKWAVYGTETEEPEMERESRKETSSTDSRTSSPPSSILSAEDANLTVKVSSETKRAEPAAGKDAVSVLMSQPLGDVLAAMGQDGWEVKPLDADKGLYELFLPAVDYDLGMGSVSIPSPHFIATLQESPTGADAEKRERCTANLVLQNGDGILTVKLGFPISTTLSLSAAGEVKARLGQWSDAVYLQGDVELGLWIPKVPGLSKIMKAFVKSYANQSILECARALANRADEIARRDDVNQKSAIAVAVATAAVAATEGELVGTILTVGESIVERGMFGL
eukprot:TRINITY_DN105030_c0_g1_i1.p1 TRINITY_DN105030_c0_g1~~TRINITY_DN105030_c0_g1_i1.p1  ORF type:complete len:442 (-),score=93.72 TRINITY_DN105030_c0_g1_i1:542-1867(-)